LQPLQAARKILLKQKDKSRRIDDKK